MPSLALVSFAGGVGRTTLAASLATLAARQGLQSLAVDADPQNLLALHVGAQVPPAEGLAANAAQGLAWHSAALQTGDGAVVLPFGRLPRPVLAGWEQRLAGTPAWLADELARLDRPAQAWTFIDTPRSPAPLADQALVAADATLLVLRADPGAVALLPEALAAAGDKPMVAVINGFDASRPLQQGVRAALQQRLGPQLVPHVIHRDEAVAEAYARQAALVDFSPHAQATHDLHGLLRWLQRWFDDAR